MSRQRDPGFGLAMLIVFSLVTASVAAPVPALIPPINQCPPEPPAEPCEILTCKGGEWVSTFLAAGTACDDGDPCTYDDQCSGAGPCSGTPVVCVARGPCETSVCNGGTCTGTPKPAGTACGYPRVIPSDPPNPCGNACNGASYLCQP